MIYHTSMKTAVQRDSSDTSKQTLELNKVMLCLTKRLLARKP